jgi:6-phosphofructokinase 1
MVVSGGDAPGINAAIWNYARLAAVYGDTVIGAIGGLPGLLNEQFVPLTVEAVNPFAAQPGTMLASSRDPVLARTGARESLHGILDRHSIDNILLFGGNGTLHHVLPLLSVWELRVVGIPTTIDNDVPGTAYTLGFDSACNYAYQAVDGVRATALALPGRIFMLETLGGHTGMLALAVAHGAGADAVLVPEYAYENEWLADRLLNAIKIKGHALLVLSEGVKAARTLADEIPQWTGIRMRDIRLGHGQRGGNPTHRDRTFAAQCAQLALEALHSGQIYGTVIVRDGDTQFHEGDMPDRLTPVMPDRALYDWINGLNIGQGGAQ